MTKRVKPTALRWLTALALAIALLAVAGCDMRFGSGSYIMPPPAPDLSDPPTRVARLSYLEGPVSFQPAGVEAWSPAVVNRPLTAGDALWTDNSARAELHFGFAALRLDARTHLAFLALDDSSVQATLTQGAISFRVRKLDEGVRFEIDTPNVSVTPSGAGEFRVEVHPESNSTEVIVRAGHAEVTDPKRAFEVSAGKRVRIGGTRRVSYKINAASRPDAFDEFCQARDRREDRSESSKYVSQEVIGYSDLDDSGIWLTHPVWGAYWTPRRVPAGWAPYRFGNWAWIEPLGWTWIDQAPWGFAPFHYGRWILLDSGWGWIPGPPGARSIYAPALAVFVGGSAGVAWFPLGPGEVYVPPYRCSRRYLTNINVSDTVIEHRADIPDVDMTRQTYVNRAAAGALTAMSREAFTTGQPVGRVTVAVSAREAALSRVIGATAPLAPKLQSLAPSPAGLRVPEPPSSARREVILRGAPPPAPVAFEQRRLALEEHPGRPLDHETLDQLSRATAPAQAPKKAPKSKPAATSP